MHPQSSIILKCDKEQFTFPFVLKKKFGAIYFMFAQFALVFFPICSLKKISIKKWADCVPKTIMVKNVDQDPFHITLDPFCNIFTFNFYHSKSYSMTMNIWTFEKVGNTTSIKLLRAKSPHAWTHSWVWTPCTWPATIPTTTARPIPWSLWPSGLLKRLLDTTSKNC